MVHDRINELLGNEPTHCLSCAEVTAAMAMADINILGMETINPGLDTSALVLVLYEYKWRYGEEQQQTKWNRAVYMWRGGCYTTSESLAYYDEEAIMLDIMERVASVRGALSEATGAPRHGRF